MYNKFNNSKTLIYINITFIRIINTSFNCFYSKHCFFRNIFCTTFIWLAWSLVNECMYTNAWPLFLIRCMFNVGGRFIAGQIFCAARRKPTKNENGGPKRVHVCVREWMNYRRAGRLRRYHERTRGQNTAYYANVLRYVVQRKQTEAEPPIPLYSLILLA